MPVYDARFDLNNDGKIDDADITIMEKIVAGVITTPPALIKQADFNDDGKLNALDLTLLGLHYGAVKPSSFPLGVAAAGVAALGILLIATTSRR